MFRVLIADDSALFRGIVHKGIQVHRDKRYLDINFASDGAEALKILNQKEIDIAFIDINMPHLSGPQLVAELPETRSKNCLVVAISGNMDVKSEAVLQEYGAYHFMQKPFRAQDAADVFMTYIVMTETYPILVVDDSATMRKITRKVLEKSRFSFEIFEADSARNALKSILERRPDLVLTDFHMPDVDGLELAGSIRSVTNRIGIYMMSTSDTDHLERSAAFVGITGFLKKPFSAADIDSIMHSRLGLDTPKFGKTRAMFSFLERDFDISSELAEESDREEEAEEDCHLEKVLI
ncbi:response regulator [uncultured Cohaesibacter sp.]|uniref:response regulator n=1 Tax=uncultured Cohaesibacter sp. TaxID=1002546 RepID=UPI00292FF363|nr:response regulator [uncultured Cohaesibacter sp.]